MRLLKTMIAGAAASIGAAAHAQVPIGLTPLPDPPRAAPAMPADPPLPGTIDAPPAVQPLPGMADAPPAVPPYLETDPAAAAKSSCTPGHCTHRLAIARRRCKRRLQEMFIGYPEEFERPELGALMHATHAVSITNAADAAMILRPYDFEPGSTRLNLRGGDRLRDIGRRLPISFAPVVIERTRDAALDASRRSAVVAALGSGPIPIPEGRVIVGRSTSQGLNGLEAILIDNTEITRTSLAGPPVGVGTASSSPAGAR